MPASYFALVSSFRFSFLCFSRVSNTNGKSYTTEDRCALGEIIALSWIRPHALRERLASRHCAYASYRVTGLFGALLLSPTPYVYSGHASKALTSSLIHREEGNRMG